MFDELDVDLESLLEHADLEVLVVLVQQDLGVSHGAEAQRPDAECSEEAGVGGGREDGRYYRYSTQFYSVDEVLVHGVDLGVCRGCGVNLKGRRGVGEGNG